MGMASGARAMAEAPVRELLILYSGNTLGELKPCGCAKEEDQGGFERRMTFFKQSAANAKNTLFVDTGDSFKEPTRQGKIKARYLMQAMSRLKYDAVVPGDKDLMYGEAFLEQGPSIPWLLSNLELAGLNLPRMRIKQLANGLKVAVLAVADPHLFYAAQHSGGRVSDPEETVRTLIKKLKESEKPDLIVLLTHMKRERALPLLELQGVDVLINGHIEKETDTIDMNPVEKNGKIFVQSGPRGQKVGELKIRFDRAGGLSFDQRMVPLDSNIKFDPEMIKWYEAYNREVEDLFFASLDARKSQNAGKKVYATEQTCRTCHPAEHEIWSGSRHGRAYETLSRVNKAFDPECLKCHVTGLDRAGGFISEVDTPELKNVQCEMCHGPGLEHAKNPQAGFGKNARQACKLCHVKNHSPRFDFSKYWPKIEH
ncbi:MAG: hypothetical protein IID18_01215 [Nitrospinae bacterium]|nr:hypothetical protein [Nitrospinota bacterium]